MVLSSPEQHNACRIRTPPAEDTNGSRVASTTKAPTELRFTYGVPFGSDLLWTSQSQVFQAGQALPCINGPCHRPNHEMSRLVLDARQLSGIGDELKRVDPHRPIHDLRELWVPGTRIVYIGKANAGSNGRRGRRNGSMNSGGSVPVDRPPLRRPADMAAGRPCRPPRRMARHRRRRGGRDRIRHDLPSRDHPRVASIANMRN